MLNKAHHLHRQAEKASRKGRVEEAIQLHKEAADILRDLLQTIINDKVLPDRIDMEVVFNIHIKIKVRNESCKTKKHFKLYSISRLRNLFVCKLNYMRKRS